MPVSPTFYSKRKFSFVGRNHRARRNLLHHRQNA